MASSKAEESLLGKRLDLTGYLEKHCSNKDNLTQMKQDLEQKLELKLTAYKQIKQQKEQQISLLLRPH